MELIAELATGHGGDVALAEDMIAAAADSGAHTIKIQSYSLKSLNPRDPQAAWLKESHLDEKAHDRLMAACAMRRVNFLSTPFDVASLEMLESFRVTRLKIASSTASEQWWRHRQTVHFVVSWPWGRKGEKQGWYEFIDAHLTAIPLYPTPLEAVDGVKLLDGWSDHTVGIEACQHMLSKGANVIEAHFYLPERSRHMPWDKSPAQLRQIRDYMDTVETMRTGVSKTFRDRWTAA